MQLLTYQELLKAPTDIQYLYMAALDKRAVGGSIIEDAIAKHPEYFPDELEYRRKWAKVPESAQFAYNEEMEALWKELHPLRTGGIRYYLQHQEEIDAHFESVKDEYKRRKKEIWEKHYGPYGLKWSDSE